MTDTTFYDRPGERLDRDDWLKRGPFCESLLKLLSSAGRQGSVVFALYGPFGEGKTTVLNFVAESLEAARKQPPVKPVPVWIHFTPWMFSNTENLLQSFFTQIGQSIESSIPSEQAEKATKAAAAFKKVGTTVEWGRRAILPFEFIGSLAGFPGLATLIGNALEPVEKALKDGAEAIKPPEKTTLEQDRRACEDAIKALDQPIFVVLDDFDRLTPDEVLLMMQLIKATASFAGLHYLLVADRANLEKHLQAKEMPPSYLEKIVQYDLTLPPVNPAILRAKLLEAFTVSIQKTTNAEASWVERWGEHYESHWQPFFSSIRAVRRFLATFEFYHEAFSEGGYTEVNLVDLWAVELLRVFAPESHRLLSSSYEVLFPNTGLFRSETERDYAAMGARTTEIIALAPEPLRPAVTKLLTYLLPQRSHSSGRDEETRSLRLCSRGYFPAYFRIDVPETMVSQAALSKWAQLAELTNTADLIGAIEQSHPNLGLSSIARAIDIRWHSWTAGQRVRFASALIEMEDRSQRHSIGIGADNVLWKHLESFDSPQRRVTALKEVAHNCTGVSPIAEVLEHDEARAWEGQSTLFDYQSRLTAFRFTAKRISELATSGELDDMRRIADALGVWSRFGSGESLRKWLVKQFSNADNALRLLRKIGSDAEIMRWNGRTKHQFFSIFPLVGYLKMSHSQIGTSLRRYAMAATDPEAKHVFEGAAWCCDRAKEDVACERDLRKSHPKMLPIVLWLPRTLQRSHSANPVIIAEVARIPSEIGVLHAPDRGVISHHACMVGNSLRAQRRPALAIVCSSNETAKAIIPYLDVGAAWLLRDGIAWIVTADSSKDVMIERERAVVVYDRAAQIIPANAHQPLGYWPEWHDSQEQDSA